MAGPPTSQRVAVLALDRVVPFDLAEADLVVIATQEPQGRLRDAGELEPEVELALAQVPDGARIMSICTGSFILAAAGLHRRGRPARRAAGHHPLGVSGRRLAASAGRSRSRISQRTPG